MHPMPAAWGMRRFGVLVFFSSAMAPNPGSCPASSGWELSQGRGQDLRSEFLLLPHKSSRQLQIPLQKVSGRSRSLSQPQPGPAPANSDWLLARRQGLHLTPCNLSCWGTVSFRFRFLRPVVGWECLL